MHLLKLSDSVGPIAKNRLVECSDSTIAGALACLESFYYAFNHTDQVCLRSVWYPHDLIQLNNPVGGITRGIEPIMAVYHKIFDSKTKIAITFNNIICYASPAMVAFTGQETGSFEHDGKQTPLNIRTSRHFFYSSADRRWFQFHHHGSIDDAGLLKTYQVAVKGA